MASRHGFALISVLWVVVALAALTGTGLAHVTVAHGASENRVQLARARWAARACLALVRSRLADERPYPIQDSVALGEVVWCRIEAIRPDERVNPNLGDSAGLMHVLDDTVRVGSVLDWIDPDDTPRSAGAESGWYRERARPLPRDRPLADPAELALIRGFEGFRIDALEAVFTTRGDGKVSPNRAPEWALRSISGVPTGLADRVLAARARSATMRGPEQVAAVLGLDPTIDEFREMVRRLSFVEERTEIRTTGFVDIGRSVLSSSIVATVQQVPQGTRILHLELR